MKIFQIISFLVATLRCQKWGAFRSCWPSCWPAWWSPSSWPSSTPPSGTGWSLQQESQSQCSDCSLFERLYKVYQKVSRKKNVVKSLAWRVCKIYKTCKSKWKWKKYYPMETRGTLLKSKRYSGSGCQQISELLKIDCTIHEQPSRRRR